jgi:hypothetical protein
MDMGFLIDILALYGLLFAGQVIGTLAHELGHLICAGIASIKVERIVIGVGPVLARSHIGDMALELRRWPVSGAVWPAPDAVPPKHWLQAVFILGGVLGNIAVIGLVSWLHAAGVAPQIIDRAGPPILLVQVWFIIATLVPYRWNLDGMPVSSDGLQLLSLISRRIANLALLRPYRSSRLRLLPSRAFLRIVDHFAHPGRDTDPGVRREVWEALRRELAQGGLPADEEMLVLDWLITDALIYADPALCSQLEAWSLRAIQLGPQVRTLIGSRGSALIEAGAYEKGKAMLEPLVSAKDTALFDGLISRIFLARAEHALGDEAAARCLMAQAREIAGTAGRENVNALIERIENEMQTVDPGAMLMHQNAHSFSRIAP